MDFRRAGSLKGGFQVRFRGTSGVRDYGSCKAPFVVLHGCYQGSLCACVLDQGLLGFRACFGFGFVIWVLRSS